MNRIKDYIIKHQIEAMMTADGYEEAFLGVVYKSGDPIAVYSYDMCIQIRMRDDNLTRQEAIDTFDYNTIDAIVPNAPLFVHFSEDIFNPVETTRSSHLIPRFSGKVDNCPLDAPQPTQEWLGL